MQILESWVEERGLDPADYGTHPMKRTRATLIYRRTKNLRIDQLLLGHSKLESTDRYLSIEVDDVGLGQSLAFADRDVLRSQVVKLKRAERDQVVGSTSRGAMGRRATSNWFTNGSLPFIGRHSTSRPSRFKTKRHDATLRP